jgi:dihydroxyacid dehydratase/phosphogluconate dehydratase
MNLLENNIRPIDIMTFEAFENSIAIVNAIGGVQLMPFFIFWRLQRR